MLFTTVLTRAGEPEPRAVEPAKFRGAGARAGAKF